MIEKTRGKRAAADELTQKKRKMAATAPLKLGGILLGGDQTARTQRTAVLEWSDDDEDLVVSPLIMQAPPRSMHTEDQSGGGGEVPEPQTRDAPGQRVREVPAQQTTGVPAGQVMGAPEQQAEVNPDPRAEEVLEWHAEQGPTVGEASPPPQNTAVDPITAPSGSGRHRRFKRVFRQTK